MLLDYLSLGSDNSYICDCFFAHFEIPRCKKRSRQRTSEQGGGKTEGELATILRANTSHVQLARKLRYSYFCYHQGDCLIMAIIGRAVIGGRLNYVVKVGKEKAAET